MMAQFSGKKSTHLLRVVQEKALEKNKIQNIIVPCLPKDCISSILICLPLDCLPRSRLVCKQWYDIVNSPDFVESHLQRTESVLIFVTSVSKGRTSNLSTTSTLPEKSNTFVVERNLCKPEPLRMFGHPVIDTATKLSVQFMEFKDGRCEIRDYEMQCLGSIRATCNGLILLDNKIKEGGLIVMNPVTRKLTTLPLGTLFPPHKESYGFVLSKLTGDYKIVHLFRDEMEYVSCEILSLKTKSWREVNGPSLGLMSWFGYRPVTAGGALHWVPDIDHSNYIVSMMVETEKFHTVMLPEECRCHDGIMEMGGALCLVTHKGVFQMDIWVLKDYERSIWSKQHSITMGCLPDMVPVLCLRVKGEMIFKREEDGSFYAYDLNLQMMRKVETGHLHSAATSSWLPHVNTLLSWDR